jgi:glycosyltransferase involved in cell wall biosynthesis
MTKELVLSTYPLSKQFQARLQGALGGAVDFVSLGQLRAMPVMQMLAHLRTLRPDRLTLAFEDADSGALAPVLKVLAGLTRAGTLAVASGDAPLQPFTRFSLIGELAGMARASCESLAAVAAARRELVGSGAQAGSSAPLRQAQRALYLNANLWFGVKAGGSVGHISGVANALMDAGYDLDFATCGGRLMVDERAAMIRLDPPKTFGLPTELNYFRFSQMAERQLARSLSFDRYAFIYQRLSIANYTGMRLSRAFGVPLVVEYNGSEVWVAQNWGTGLRCADLALRAEEQTLKSAQVVVTVSDVLRDELVARGIPADRIVSYPNCINPEMFNPASHSRAESLELRKRYGIPGDAVLVTFVGTFGPWHGAEVLARSIARFAAVEPDAVRNHRIHFLFVGDGGRRAAAQEILAEGIAGGYVTFAGLVPQADAPKHLAASDILMSPHVPNADGTAFFGSPTKLFEYMAMGKPIIASDLDQIGEVLGRGLRAQCLPGGAPPDSASAPAILFEPGNEEQIVHSLRFLVEHPSWRAALGANARREALAKYTWKHHVAAILGRLEALGAIDAGVARAS